MSVGRYLFGVGVAAAVTVGLAACSTAPLDNNGAARDAAYGIPPGSVQPDEMRPDGLLNNGLLPLPPNTGS
jgi:hypothetical protein